jgi:hypothetical protein
LLVANVEVSTHLGSNPFWFESPATPKTLIHNT